MMSPALRAIFLFLPFVLPLGLALDMYIPSVPTMAKSLGAMPTEIQLTLSVFLYGFGFGQLFLGPLSDSLGRRKILILSALLFTFGGGLCYVAKTVNILIVGRIFQALGACGTQVIAFSMVREQFEGKEATFIFSTLKAVSAIAPIAAPILGAFLQLHYSWRAVFITLSFYGLLILLLALLGIKETLKAREPLKITTIYLPAFRAAFSRTSFLYYCFCAVSAQAAMFGYFSLSPHFFIGHHVFSETQFAMLFSINAGVFLLTGTCLGKNIYNIGIRRSTFIAAVLFFISGLCMIVGNFFYESYLILFLPNLIASSGAAIMLGAAISGALLPFKTHIGIIAAFFGCLEFVGGGLIGSLSLAGQTLSVLPLGLILIVLGGTIMVLNQYATSRVKTV
jgi:MFS transporter, DHA1 family, chloramphenicol/florfenicol resistance protein